MESVCEESHRSSARHSDNVEMMDDVVHQTKNSNSTAEMDLRDVENINFSKEREEQTLIGLQIEKESGETLSIVDESLHVTAKFVADADPDLLSRIENLENAAADVQRGIENLRRVADNLQNEQ